MQKRMNLHSKKHHRMISKHRQQMIKQQMLILQSQVQQILLPILKVLHIKHKMRPVSFMNQHQVSTMILKRDIITMR